MCNLIVVSTNIVDAKFQETRNRLNYDVLGVIMVYLKFEEILRMMHTCQALYDLGIPHLLRDITLGAGTNTSEELYRYFLLSNPNRFGCIHRLTCSSFHRSRPPHLVPNLEGGNLTGLFLDSIRLGSNIQELDIWFADPSAAEQDVTTNIASLSQLRVLTLRGRPPISGLLGALSVPLTSITVQEDPHGNAWRNPEEIRDMGLEKLMPVLAKFRTSLEILSVTLDNGINVPDVFVARWDFPVVKKLCWNARNPLDASELTTTFPNVVDLEVSSYMTYQTIVHLDIDILPIRNEGLREIRTYNRGTTQWGGGRYLHSLTGEVKSLCALGLTCRVESLEVHFHSGALTGEFSALLADVQPSSLKIKSFSAMDAWLDYFEPRLLVCQSIRELEVELHLDGAGYTAVHSLVRMAVAFDDISVAICLRTVEDEVL